MNSLQDRLPAFSERAAQAVYGAEDPAKTHEILTHHVHQLLFEIGKPEEVEARIFLALRGGIRDQEA